MLQHVRIAEDPSSGSLVQCLAKNYKNDCIGSVDMNKVGVMVAYSDPLCVCVVHCIWRHWSTVNYTHAQRVRICYHNTDPVHVNGHDTVILVIFSQGSLMMDLLWSETCWSTFKYFIILIVSTYYILCISWVIKCLITIEVRCKHEDVFKRYLLYCFNSFSWLAIGVAETFGLFYSLWT